MTIPPSSALPAHPGEENPSSDSPPDAAKEPGEREAQIEERDYQQTRGQRRRLLPRAAIVGLCAGGIAFLFRAALDSGDALRERLYETCRGLPAGFLLPMTLAALATGGAVWLVRRFCPEAAGSGIPHFEAVLRGYRSLDGRRILLVKFIGGVLAGLLPEM